MNFNITGKPALRPVHILFADDGSPHSQAAVQLLCDLPLPPNSTVSALTVFSSSKPAEREARLAALERTCEILSAKDIRLSTGLRSGHPAEVISEYGDQHEVDLILIGAQGLRARLNILLGGIAQQVVEYSHRPVWVIRAPYTGLKQILLTLDGSEHSRQALSWLVQFPLPEDVQLRVINVLPPTIPSDLGRDWPVAPDLLLPLPSSPVNESDWQVEEERFGRALLEDALEELNNAGWYAETVLVRGDAASEIIAYAQNHHVDLIVAGARP